MADPITKKPEPKATYEELANQHQALLKANKLDEAAKFHDEKIKTFKDEER